jgi:D-alanyl-lipoteichoic acid acyltransferase DltB (MBOAT superfamily)
MLFDTPIYLAFLLLIVAVYWRLGFRQQNYFLLAASYFFYGWWDWPFRVRQIPPNDACSFPSLSF